MPAQKIGTLRKRDPTYARLEISFLVRLYGTKQAFSLQITASSPLCFLRVRPCSMEECLKLAQGREISTINR